MKNMIKNVLRTALILAVLLTMIPSAFAAEADNAAEVNGVEYATLADAVKAVARNAGETTITLLRDERVSGLMVGHQYVQNITVDLNGHTLSSSGIALTAYRSGTVLTVKNGTVSGNATTGTLRATYGGKLILGDNLTIKGAGGSAALVYIDNGAAEVIAEDGVEFVGGKLDFKQSANVNNKLTVAASVGRTYFSTLTAALAAAEDGDTLTLMDDAVLTDTALSLTKDITVDFNGKTITGTFNTVETAFVSIEKDANVVLKDSKGNGGLKALAGEKGQLSNLVRAQKGGYVTIKSGSYYQDKSVNGAGMIDTRHNEGVIIEGGTFELGNLGKATNGSPWLLNASGQNTAHITVKGGTFVGADIQHQYYPFEVEVIKEKALHFEDGKYTVVDAVAYVTEAEWSSNWYYNEVGYATLEEAIAACESPKTKTYYKKDYVSEQERVVLLQDVQLTGTLDIIESFILDLNGFCVSAAAFPAVTTCADVTIDGTKDGSMITASQAAGEVCLISVESGSCTVNGGSYSIATAGAGTKTSPATVIKAAAGTALQVSNAKVTAVDTTTGTVVCIMNAAGSTLEVTGCEVIATAEKSLDNIAVHAKGSAVLTDSVLIGESDYTGAGNQYTGRSNGVSSAASLEMNNCYVWGSHAGVLAQGAVTVNGGTYEGYGHGGIYFTGAGTTSYIYDAAINWAAMREGTYADSVAGTNGAGVYIGGKSNITVYMDNCSVYSTLYGVVLRNSGGEKNNHLYVSNSTFTGCSKFAYRNGKGGNNNLEVYSGVGNDYSGITGTIANYSSHYHETGESYAKTAAVS